VRLLCGNTVPLGAGDFILSRYNDAATIAFCFKNGDDKFGLTVAHLADQTDDHGKVLQPGVVGDFVYAFNSDSRGPENANGYYETVKIGEIVDIHRETDSIIFKLHEGFEIAPFCLPQQLGMTQPFRLPSATTASSFKVGTVFAGFGAQRRGASGRNTTSYEAENGLLVDDIAVYSFDPDNSTSRADGEKQITDSGDWGMLWYDEHGTPWGMHHLINITHEGRSISYGVPLRKVLEGHPKYFGENSFRQQSTPMKRKLSQSQGQVNLSPVDTSGGGHFIKKHLHFFKDESRGGRPFHEQLYFYSSSLEHKEYSCRGSWPLPCWK